MQRRVDPGFLRLEGEGGTDLARGSSLVDQRTVCQLTQSADPAATQLTQSALSATVTSSRLTQSVDQAAVREPTNEATALSGSLSSASSAQKVPDDRIPDYSSHPLVLGRSCKFFMGHERNIVPVSNLTGTWRNLCTGSRRPANSDPDPISQY